MAIKLDMLRCFVAVAESGNLNDAAARLGRTQPAVSMMLKQFEKQLTTPLFETGRKNRLTELGAIVLDLAQRGVDHFQQTIIEIEHASRADTHSIRVAAVPSVAEAILPEAVGEFIRDYPGVQIDLQDMSSASLLRELERGRIDFGIGTGTSASIVREELISDSFGLVCPVNHPLIVDEQPIDWSALAPWPFIANEACSYIVDEDFQRICTGSKLMVCNIFLLLDLVRAGVGITVLPKLATNWLGNQLSFRPIVDKMAVRRIAILRSVNSESSSVTETFAKIVRRVVRAKNLGLYTSESGRAAKAEVSRRMLDLASILENAKRTDTVKISKMDRQTPRDWEACA